MSVYLGTEYIAGIPANYVTTDTAQTISGNKSVTGNLVIKGSLPLLTIQNTAFVKGDIPAAVIRNSYFHLTDSEGSNLSGIYGRIDTNGNVYTALTSYLNEAGSNNNAQIGITYSKDGTVSTNAPASDALNAIVTTTGISKNPKGYVKLGNGLIIQWGTETSTPIANHTVTFPVPFTNSSSYTIVKNYSSSASTNMSDREGSFYDRTATTAVTYNASVDNTDFQWLAIGY